MVEENPKDGIVIINVGHTIHATENFGSGLVSELEEQEEFKKIVVEYDKNKEKDQALSIESQKALQILINYNQSFV